MSNIPDDYVPADEVLRQSRVPDDDAKTVAGVDLVCFADVTPEPVRWVWRNHIAAGKMTLLGGPPSNAKSQILVDVSSRISRGMAWPDGGQALKGSVVIVSAEDGIADTIRPRIDAADGDPQKIHVLKSVRDASGKPRAFSLQDDLDSLRSVVNVLKDVRLVGIDPITSYLGSDIDSHRTSDIRAILDPFADFANDTGVAVLAITHPPKGAQSSAINSFTGSLAFVAAARLAFVVFEEQETGRRLLLPVKNNLGPLASGTGYRIDVVDIGNGIEAPHIVWDGDPVNITANEALRAATSGERESKMDAAKEFLFDRLSHGPQSQDGLLDIATRHGISEKTLRRAKAALNVESYKSDFNGKWAWTMPGDDQK